MITVPTPTDNNWRDSDYRGSRPKNENVGQHPYTPPGPCSVCANAPHCAEKETACGDFLVFVETGRTLYRDRATSQRAFARVFNHDDYHTASKGADNDH